METYLMILVFSRMQIIWIKGKTLWRRSKHAALQTQSKRVRTADAD